MSKYSGWTNYETWNVNLWLNNDWGTQGYWDERAQELLTDAGGDKEKACYRLAKSLEDEVGQVPDGVTGMMADLLGAALSEVNWGEVAEHFIESAAEVLS